MMPPDVELFATFMGTLLLIVMGLSFGLIVVGTVVSIAEIVQRIKGRP